MGEADGIGSGAAGGGVRGTTMHAGRERVARVRRMPEAMGLGVAVAEMGRCFLGGIGAPGDLIGQVGCVLGVAPKRNWPMRSIKGPKVLAGLL
jgi:hypothetical protein